MNREYTKKIYIDLGIETWEAYKESGQPILDPHRRKKDLLYMLGLELKRKIQSRKNRDAANSHI